uniref:Uncharacterized protein n=1 Tax=Lotus japonicus TaxID=34305 RepID=I3RZ60_LOTJA|nr:unknown [Lotus japonicus]
MGYSNTTSLPDSFLYTAAKVSSLYSVLFRSFGSKKTFIILDPSTRYLTRFPTISAGNTTSSSIAS